MAMRIVPAATKRVCASVYVEYCIEVDQSMGEDERNNHLMQTLAAALSEAGAPSSIQIEDVEDYGSESKAADDGTKTIECMVHATFNIVINLDDAEEMDDAIQHTVWLAISGHEPMTCHESDIAIIDVVPQD